MWLIISLIGFFLFMAVGTYIGEKIRYNNGVCEKCGDVLKWFDTDSQMNHGFKCERCKEYVGWFSAPFVINWKLHE